MIPGVKIVWTDQAKEGLKQYWSSEPIRLLLKQKGLWPARQGHPGRKTLQMWTARTSQSKMDTPLVHAQEEAMPLVEWALTPLGHCNPKEEYAKVIESTNHLEIICFVTGPPLVWLPKPTKKVLTFCTRQNTQCILLGPGRGRAGIPGCPSGGGGEEQKAL